MRNSIVIVSYNTHGGVGMDRRFAPDRIARVLAEIGADIIALQELELRANGFDMLAYLQRETGFHSIAGPTIRSTDRDFGNGLLSRFPIVSVAQVTLDVARREPRGAIDALVDCGGAPLRVIATHLGLRPSERRDQVKRLLDTVRAGPSLPTVLLGDLNEWLLRGRPLRWLHEHFGESPAHATFPSPLPLLALDRIWSSPASLLRRVRVHRSRLARRASDHLPLVARLGWDPD
ncbi:MAG TPA: endonuclease/exonuclease/phosphatase family protein [Rudaea sp.]|nr:endonuclease/exonuclease/phosphatase family protein [Rudaea sp.]